MADPSPSATILSLIGPDLDPSAVTIDSLAPGANVTIVPNTSPNNTLPAYNPAPLRRCYQVTTEAPLSIVTGLPAQVAPGSFLVTVTPICEEGRFFEGLFGAHYDPVTGVLEFACNFEQEEPLAQNGLSVYLSVDLAHSLTR